MVWQVLILFAVWLITWQYIIPGLSKIDDTLGKADKAIANYSEARDKWLEYGKLSAILTELWNKEELLKIIQATPVETQKALQKNGNSEYLVWLKNAINASDEDKKKLIQSKKKINSILPTMSPISANIDEDNITLKQYIKFIEWRLIHDFNLDSNIALGIQGLVYGNNANGVPSNIGMFDLRLDFKASNKNIKKFIDFVNESWNNDILNKTELLTEDQIPGIMSNPLITMESFSLQNTLDLTNPEKINNGRATIRFYMRWSSKDDVTYLRDSLRERKDLLEKKIDASVNDCRKNEVLCSQLARLENFQKKYKEFLRWVIEKSAWSGINDIYALSQQVTSIRALEAEFESYNTKLTQ